MVGAHLVLYIYIYSLSLSLYIYIIYIYIISLSSSLVGGLYGKKKMIPYKSSRTVSVWDFFCCVGGLGKSIGLPKEFFMK